VLVDQGEQRGQGGAPQVGGDHDAHRRQPVHDRAGQRGEGEDGQDLGDHHTGHAEPGAGQAEHEHDQDDGVEGVAPSRDRLGGEQALVGGVGEHRPPPRPSPWPPLPAHRPIVGGPPGSR